MFIQFLSFSMTHLLYFKRIWFRQAFSSANRRTASPTAIVPRPQALGMRLMGMNITHSFYHDRELQNLIFQASQQTPLSDYVVGCVWTLNQPQFHHFYPVMGGFVESDICLLSKSKPKGDAIELGYTSLRALAKTPGMWGFLWISMVFSFRFWYVTRGESNGFGVPQCVLSSHCTRKKRHIICSKGAGSGSQGDISYHELRFRLWAGKSISCNPTTRQRTQYLNISQPSMDAMDIQWLDVAQAKTRSPRRSRSWRTSGQGADTKLGDREWMNWKSHLLCQKDALSVYTLLFTSHYILHITKMYNNLV